MASHCSVHNAKFSASILRSMSVLGMLEQKNLEVFAEEK